MGSYNSTDAPDGIALRRDGHVPFASQIPNDSVVNGDTVGDAMTANMDLSGSATDLDLNTTTDEVKIALGGSSDDEFVPTLAIVDISSATGTVAGDAALTIGTASAGTQVLSATTLTGLNAAGEKFAVDLTGVVKASIAANATLYVTTQAGDSTATTLVGDVKIYGKVIPG